jgi:hypothetical protein
MTRNNWVQARDREKQVLLVAGDQGRKVGWHADNSLEGCINLVEIPGHPFSPKNYQKLYFSVL